VTDFLKDGGKTLIDLLKTQGIPAITTSLGKLSADSNEPWQKALLKLGVNLVSKHGPEGLDLLEAVVAQLQSGKSIDLSALSLQEASDLLAVMQRREAETRNQVALYTQMVVEALGKVLGTLVSILFKGL